MSEKKICPNCEAITDQVPSTRLVTLRIKGKKVTVRVNGFVCNECGDFIYDVDEVLETAYSLVNNH